MLFSRKKNRIFFKLLLNNDHPPKQQFPKSTHSSFHVVFYTTVKIECEKTRTYKSKLHILNGLVVV